MSLRTKHAPLPCRRAERVENLELLSQRQHELDTHSDEKTTLDNFHLDRRASREACRLSERRGDSHPEAVVSLLNRLFEHNRDCHVAILVKG